jgi:hypothetical protein
LHVNSQRKSSKKKNSNSSRLVYQRTLNANLKAVLCGLKKQHMSISV